MSYEQISAVKVTNTRAARTQALLRGESSFLEFTRARKEEYAGLGMQDGLAYKDNLKEWKASLRKVSALQVKLERQTFSGTFGEEFERETGRDFLKTALKGVMIYMGGVGALLLADTAAGSGIQNPGWSIVPGILGTIVALPAARTAYSRAARWWANKYRPIAIGA